MENRVIDALADKLMDIAQRLVRTMSTTLALRVVIAFVNLKVRAFFVIGFL